MLFKVSAPTFYFFENLNQHGLWLTIWAVFMGFVYGFEMEYVNCNRSLSKGSYRNLYKVSNEANYHVWLNSCSAYVSTQQQKTDCNNGSVIADFPYHRNEQVMITLKYLINVNHIKGHIEFSLAGI